MKIGSNLAKPSLDVNSGKELDIQRQSQNKITHMEKGNIWRERGRQRHRNFSKPLSFAKLP